jgi:hypothetical protein
LSLEQPSALNNITIGISSLIFGIVALILPPLSDFSILTLNCKAGLLLSSFYERTYAFHEYLLVGNLTLNTRTILHAYLSWATITFSEPLIMK